MAYATVNTIALIGYSRTSSIVDIEKLFLFNALLSRMPLSFNTVTILEIQYALIIALLNIAFTLNFMESAILCTVLYAIHNKM